MAEEKKIVEKVEKAKHLYQYSESELCLIRRLSVFSDVIKDVVFDFNVSYLTHYAIDLARDFHDFYEQRKVISEDKDSTIARLQLILATQIVLKESLRLLGVSAPEKM